MTFAKGFLVLLTAVVLVIGDSIDVDEALAVMNLQREVVEIFVSIPVRMVKDLVDGFEAGYISLTHERYHEYKGGENWENFTLNENPDLFRQLLLHRTQHLGEDMPIVYYSASIQSDGSYFGIVKEPKTDGTFACGLDCNVCNGTQAPNYFISFPMDCESGDIDFDPASLPSWVGPPASSPYDPRTRPFYEQAVNVGNVTWVPSYVFITLGQVLGIGVVSPFHFPNGTMHGVVACEYTMSFISQFLKDNSHGIGIAYIVDNHDSMLIGASEGALQTGFGGTVSRILPRDSDSEAIRATAEAIQERYGDDYVQQAELGDLALTYDDANTRQMVQVIGQLIRDDYGLDWLFVVTLTPRCRQGQFFNTTENQCESCPFGHYMSEAGLQTVCYPCSPGTYSPREGAEICIRCPNNQFSNVSAMSFCYECPPNTAGELGGTGDCPCISLVGTFKDITVARPFVEFNSTENMTDYNSTMVVSVVDELTRNGFFTEGGVGVLENRTMCSECTAGAVCEGGQIEPYSQPGYWNPSHNNSVFYKCKGGADACPGRGFCAIGYDPSTVTCFGCDTDYYEFANKCYSCTLPEAFSYFVLLLMLLWFPCQKWLATKVTKAFYVYYPYLQTLAIISSLDLSWPQSISQSMSVFSFVNFNTEITQIECSGWGARQYWFFYMSLPFIYMGWFVCRLLVIKLTSNNPEKVEKKAGSFFANWAFYFNSLYIMLFNQSLDMAVCADFGGVEAVKRIPSIRCSDRGGALTAAWLGIIFFGIGFPFAIALMLWRLRFTVAARDDGAPVPNHLKGLKFFWGRFEKKYYWWELVVVLRKMGMVLIFKLVNDGIVQAVLTLLLVYLTGLAQYYARPFQDVRHDYLDSFLFSCQFFLLLIGVLFYVDGLNQTNLKTFFFVCLSISLIASGGLSVIQIYEYSQHKVNKEMRRFSGTIGRVQKVFKKIEYDDTADPMSPKRMSTKLSEMELDVYAGNGEDTTLS